MDLIKFIVWLSTGAVIGWLAGRLGKVEHKQILKPYIGEDRSSAKG